MGILRFGLAALLVACAGDPGDDTGADDTADTAADDTGDTDTGLDTADTDPADTDSGDPDTADDKAPHRLIGIAADGTLHEVSVADGTSTSIGALDRSSVTKLTVDRTTGVVWALRNTGTVAELLTLDPCDATTTFVATVSLPTTWGGAFEGFARSDTGAGLYVAYGSTQFESDRLGTLDTGTGEVTDVAVITGTLQGEIDDLGFADGVLYGRDGDSVNGSVLYRIDLTTAAATTIGTYDPVIVHPRGLATNPDDGRHYVAESTGQLYEVDLGTAEATAIGSPPSSPWVELEFVDDACL